jgi:hypothetical protein
MNATEREGLKEQLRAMAAGRGDGIDLDCADRWVIEGLTDAVAFFRHLGDLIPPDSILYFSRAALLSRKQRGFTKRIGPQRPCALSGI